MAALTFFRLEITDSVAHLILNRPEKANGMNMAFWQELPQVMHQLDGDMAIRALVVSGAGKHFSGGVDFTAFAPLFEIAQGEPGRAAYATRQAVLEMQTAFTAIERARFPVIAALHGVCMGAAVDLISACDLRLAAEGTQFSIEEVSVGMAADVGTLQRLPKLIGPGIVKELAYTGRGFGVEEARSWGLLNSVHPDRDATLDAAFTLAKTIASKSPLAVAGIKHAIDYVRDHTVADSLEHIATWNGGILRPDELNTAIQARIEKKEAVFADLIDTATAMNTKPSSQGDSK